VLQKNGRITFDDLADMAHHQHFVMDTLVRHVIVLK
jgi:hypothetical protein